MEMIHTSPVEIKKVNNAGLFGSFLCFSQNEYVMTCSGSHFSYKIEIDDSELIEASRLFYHPEAELLNDLVLEVCKKYGVDEDTAEDLISEKENGFDVIDEFDSDDSWDMQHRTARAAKILGYRGCIMKDEQGTLYMIDMLGKECELKQV